MTSRPELAEQLLEVIGGILLQNGLSTEIDLNSPVDRRLGLDSLDWAAVAVHMEERTGLDPFSEGAQVDLNTIEDLVCLYEQCSQKSE